MPAAPASGGHGGEAAVPRAGAAAGHDPAAAAFRLGEPEIVRAGVELRQLAHAEEGQPWLTLDWKSQIPSDGCGQRRCCVCVGIGGCALGRGVLVGNVGHWGLKIPPCSHERA